jgi:ribosomal protein S18 acetylase RimI-like enzyme
VACDFAGRPIGFISAAKKTERQVRIMLFAVSPQYRDRGVGAQLLTALRMRAGMEGLTSITLEVRMTNIGARKFYRKHGLMETVVLPAYYQDGGEGVRMDGPVQLNI